MPNDSLETILVSISPAKILTHILTHVNDTLHQSNRHPQTLKKSARKIFCYMIQNLNLFIMVLADDNSKFGSVRILPGSISMQFAWRIGDLLRRPYGRRHLGRSVDRTGDIIWSGVAVGKKSFGWQDFFDVGQGFFFIIGGVSRVFFQHRWVSWIFST